MDLISTSSLGLPPSLNFMGSSGAQAAELVLNGTPLGSGRHGTAGSAWSTANGLLVNPNSAKAPDPLGFEFTSNGTGRGGQGPSTLIQSNLPTIPGGSYTLSFDIEDVPWDGAGGSGVFNIFLDGVLLNSFSENGILAGKGYVTDFYTTGGGSAFGEINDLVANPGPSGSVLSFSGTGHWYLDNVSLLGPIATN